ncbi:hypothetical protein H0H93_008115 [Arthromyces matolae]|nr:hypothetical protein H0H93_008115 [Arthromyces matolae]
MDTKNVVIKEKIATHDLDTESLREGINPIDEATGEAKLVRQLKNRHIAMISIGGVIGTGLFLGTATALKNGGPLGLWLGYTIMGSICYCVMISLGEMVAYLPIPGGHIKLAERFVNPALSFTMGWNYWYNWTIILPAELSAAAILIGFWSDINPAVWITITLLVTVAINFMGAGAYGEAEFIFAPSSRPLGGPNHDRIGFRYWKNPGALAQFAGIPGAKGRFLAWWAVMTQAAFSFIGTEIVAIAAGEAKNPRRNLPRAIKRVYIRICLFYILGTFVIGLLVPHNAKGLNLSTGTAASSPFVLAIQSAGIKALPSIINACLLTSAWSAASSDLYTSSRALYGLAKSGNAPRIFLKTSKKGLPWVSLLFSSSFALLSYMGVSGGAGRVFNWFANMTSVAGLLTWFGICVTYVRFHKGMKVQGYDRKKLPFSSSLQPYAAWYAIVWCLLICLTSGWQVFLKGNWAVDTFVTNYLPLALFPVLYFTVRFTSKTPIIDAQDMDFVSDIAEIEAETTDDPPPKNALDAFWQWLVWSELPYSCFRYLPIVRCLDLSQILPPPPQEMDSEKDNKASGRVDDKAILSADPDSVDTLENGVQDITGEVKLVRQLKNRHIAMIRCASSLSGLLLGYIVMGSICYSVMISLGEMVAYLPIPGGHIKLAERFVDPALSFTMGWNYWYNWTIILPAELSAAAVIIGFWSDVNPAVWITITLVITVAINMLGAGIYGEAEFIFASVKVVTIVLRAVPGGPNHDRIGFRYWKNPGPFNQYLDIPGAKGRFLAWWAVMTQAAFSFIGTEIVAVRTCFNDLFKSELWLRPPFLPLDRRWGSKESSAKSTKSYQESMADVCSGILLFYIGGTTIIGLLVPYTAPGLDLADGTAASSPFVIAIQNAGIKVLPSVRFFADPMCTESCDGLAVAGNAPRTSGWKVFLRGQWATDTFITNYLPLIAFPILYTSSKLVTRKPAVRADEMDFVSNITEIEADTYDDPPPRNKIEAVWQWLAKVLIDDLQDVT